MFGKIAQFRSFITHAVTSINSQRPSLPSDPQLDRKLKFLLDFILRNPTEEQFKAYHSLQSPQMTLNQILKQIYHSQQADTTQISSIIHFFTFLLINCNNELVICKIVSDKFVIELTSVHLEYLEETIVNKNVEIQQINSYKIALIKAYVSKINQETIKYMIQNDRMCIFQNCVKLYEQYIQTQEEQQFGVESTCISNCMLLIIKHLASYPQNSLNICNQEGKKGVVYLLVKMVQNIHKIMLQILNSTAVQDAQILKDKIMFLIDIFNSISVEEIKAKIITQTSKELTDLRELFKEIVLQHMVLINQSQQDYIKNLELIKVLLKLLAIYYSTEALLPIFEECSLPLLHKFITVFKANCKEIFLKSTHVIQAQQVVQRQLRLLLADKIKIACIFCSNMEILASIIKGGQYLSRRNIRHHKQVEFKNIIINILIDIIELLLSEQGQPIQQMLCYKSIKCLLLSLMQLTMQNEHTLHEYSVVKFHQFAISMFKKHLKKSQLWDYVVLHYESLLKMVSNNLLLIEDSEPLEYSFCQFHDPNKVKEPHHLDALINVVLINECSRHFRFMTVDRTKVDLKDIRLEKNYHMNFITAGWNLEPGTEITSEMKEISQLVHFSKGIKIPISVIEDQECLLFCISEEKVKKIILNIRYKSIQGFFVEKETVHIRLKGLQQILVQANSKNPKQNLKKFRQYLTKSRDHSRQRQLKFIHHYLDTYFRDNLAIIQEMGQAQIQVQSDDSRRQIKQQIKVVNQVQIESDGEHQQERTGPEAVENGEAQVVDDL